MRDTTCSSPTRRIASSNVSGSEIPEKKILVRWLAMIVPAWSL